MALSTEAAQLIGELNYMATFSKNPTDSVSRVIEIVIYDPLATQSPQQHLLYLREALASDTKLSELGPNCTFSEEWIRLYLTEVANRIESGEEQPSDKIDPKAMFPSPVDHQLRQLLKPLTMHPNREEASLWFLHHELDSKNKLSPLEQAAYHAKKCRDTISLIRYALRNRAALTQLIQSPYSESEIRSYLLELAFKIKEILKQMR